MAEPRTLRPHDTHNPRPHDAGTSVPLALTLRSAATRKPAPGPGDPRRATLIRRVRWFVAATISYNVIEAVIALTEGVRASSTALIGFGLDSVIEVSSAAAVAWQFTAADPERRERVTLRIIALSFFALALYVTVSSVAGLLGSETVRHSPVGIIVAATSLIVMPRLSWAQRRAGRELRSATAVADSKQTLLCTYLSAVLLVGLVLNSAFGWSWADPVAALVIAAIATREGINAWRGEACCAASGTTSCASSDATGAPRASATQGSSSRLCARCRDRRRRCTSRRSVWSDPVTV